MSKETSSTGVITFALVGGAIGAIAALLLAPKSGQQLRSDVVKQLVSISSCAKELASSVGTHTKDMVSSISEHTKESTQTALDGVKSDINSMAPTEKDMIKHGKEMENMPTNSKVSSNGQVPDPSQ